MKKNELDQVLKLHALYLSGLPEGIRADLSGANLSGADLSGADLSWADLSRANLSRANLSGANLSWADLSRANLSGANLSGANLSGANLSGANLSGANLSRANLSGADLSGADLSWANLSRANLSGADLSGADLSWADLSGAINIPYLPHTIIVPEGELIVWKKVSNGIAKLKIPKDALRSNGTTRKCRASYAVVLDCPKGAVSLHNPYFKYIKGRKVVCDKWEPNRWIECGGGIHFFLTKEEAEAY